MTEQVAQVIAKDPNPLNIAPEKVKVFSMLHKCTPQEAFGALLAKDLLERLTASEADECLKAVVKVLVTSVVGDGSVVKV